MFKQAKPQMNFDQMNFDQNLNAILEKLVSKTKSFTTVGALLKHGCYILGQIMPRYEEWVNLYTEFFSPE